MKKLKMLQKKHIFQQKSSRNIFKSISDMDLIFGGDRKIIPWAHFEAIIKSPTHQMISPLHL